MMKQMLFIFFSLSLSTALAGDETSCEMVITKVQTPLGAMDPKFIYDSEVVASLLPPRNLVLVEKPENAVYSMEITVEGPTPQSLSLLGPAEYGDEENCVVRNNFGRPYTVRIVIKDLSNPHYPDFHACKNVSSRWATQKNALKRGILKAMVKLPYSPGCRE